MHPANCVIMRSLGAVLNFRYNVVSQIMLKITLDNMRLDSSF